MTKEPVTRTSSPRSMPGISPTTVCSCTPSLSSSTVKPVSSLRNTISSTVPTSSVSFSSAGICFLRFVALPGHRARHASHYTE